MAITRPLSDITFDGPKHRHNSPIDLLMNIVHNVTCDVNLFISDIMCLQSIKETTIESRQFLWLPLQRKVHVQVTDQSKPEDMVLNKVHRENAS